MRCRAGRQNWSWSQGQILAAQGHSIIHDGKPVESAEENLSELNAQARTFADKQLPVLKALAMA